MNLVEQSIDLSRMRGLKIADKQYVENLINISPSDSCENNFTNLFAWGDACNTRFLDLDDRLVPYNSDDQILFYPIGKPTPPQELKEIASAYKSANLLKYNYIYNVPANYKEMFKDADEYLKLVADEADADYIYDIDKLISLSGAKLRKKRNHIKHFTAQNPDYSIEPLDAKNFDQARDFINEIDEIKGLLVEEIAIKSALENFESLGLHGVILRSKADKIAAVAILGRINSDTYSVHFEKSDKNIEGAAQMIVQVEAEAIKRFGASKMNREQDLGDPNLKHAKESLDPSQMYRPFRAYF